MAGIFDEIEQQRRAARRARARLNQSTFRGNLGPLRGLLDEYISQRFGGALEQAQGRAGVQTNFLANFGTTTAFDLASTLQDVRSQLSGLAEEAKLARGPSQQEEAITGALTGFATGGPLGAVAGLVGGGLSGRRRRRTERKREGKIAQAQQVASPEGFAQTLEEVTPAAREAALASGQGQLRAQAVEEAIAMSGLRGTGLGDLASVAAGLQPEMAGFEAAMQAALAETSRKVQSLVGANVRAEGDPVVRALEGLANAFLAGRSVPGSGPFNPVPAEQVPEGFGTSPLIPGYAPTTEPNASFEPSPFFSGR